MNSYRNAAVFWDGVFRQKDASVPENARTGNEQLDKCLAWLTQNTKSILDFGCGNGTVLFWCSYYGTERHIGIDLSEQAILNAQKRSMHMRSGEFRFRCGGIDVLKRIDSASVDAVVLSNIVDNLYPEDARQLVSETKRILTGNGKVFVKLNPYMTQEEIEAYGIKVIEGNVLDDGLILRNNTTEQWKKIFEQNFTVC